MAGELLLNGLFTGGLYLKSGMSRFNFYNILKWSLYSLMFITFLLRKELFRDAGIIFGLCLTKLTITKTLNFRSRF
jgi:hypothetical protein